MKRVLLLLLACICFIPNIFAVPMFVKTTEYPIEDKVLVTSPMIGYIKAEVHIREHIDTKEIEAVIVLKTEDLGYQYSELTTILEKDFDLLEQSLTTMIAQFETRPTQQIHYRYHSSNKLWITTLFSNGEWATSIQLDKTAFIIPNLSLKQILSYIEIAEICKNKTTSK